MKPLGHIEKLLGESKVDLWPTFLLPRSPSGVRYPFQNAVVKQDDKIVTRKLKGK
jgi:hypothetical protein